MSMYTSVSGTLMLRYAATTPSTPRAVKLTSSRRRRERRGGCGCCSTRIPGSLCLCVPTHPLPQAHTAHAANTRRRYRGCIGRIPPGQSLHAQGQRPMLVESGSPHGGHTPPCGPRSHRGLRVRIREGCIKLQPDYQCRIGVSVHRQVIQAQARRKRSRRVRGQALKARLHRLAGVQQRGA